MGEGGGRSKRGYYFEVERPMPRKRRYSSHWWNQDIRLLEKKLGIFGTRSATLTAIGWVIGIAVTPWLRWFVSGSLLLGLLLATVFQ